MREADSENVCSTPEIRTLPGDRPSMPDGAGEAAVLRRARLNAGQEGARGPKPLDDPTGIAAAIVRREMLSSPFWLPAHRTTPAW